MNKGLRLLLSLAVTLLLPNMVLAHKGEHFQKIFKELNLTDKQKTQMDELKAKKTFTKEDRQKIKELRGKFFAALKANTSDSDLTKMHQEMQALKSKKAESRFKHMLGVRKILTEDQRKKFHELREKRMKDWKDKDDDDKD